MAYYPVFLELRDRPCLVVGGGAVAERKVEGLLDAGARVTVVSPVVTDRIATWAASAHLVHVPRAYRYGDLAAQELVFVAIDDAPITPAIVAEARERRVWVNAADDARHSDFILPSVLRRGALTVAVGTGGASPALARLIREELETYFTDDYGPLVDVAAEVRRELRQRGQAASGESWRRAFDDAGARRLIAEGRRDEAKARLLSRLGASGCGRDGAD